MVTWRLKLFLYPIALWDCIMGSTQPKIDKNTISQITSDSRTLFFNVITKRIFSTTLQDFSPPAILVSNIRSTTPEVLTPAGDTDSVNTLSVFFKNENNGLLGANSDGSGVSNSNSDGSGVSNSNSDGSGVSNSNSDGSGVSNSNSDGSGVSNSNSDGSGVSNSNSKGRGVSNSNSKGRGVLNYNSKGGGVLNYNSEDSGVFSSNGKGNFTALNISSHLDLDEGTIEAKNIIGNNTTTMDMEISGKMASQVIDTFVVIIVRCGLFFGGIALIFLVGIGIYRARTHCQPEWWYDKI